VASLVHRGFRCDLMWGVIRGSSLLFYTNEISTIYPRWTDFSELCADHDPKGQFTNPLS
jgi:hypothetical protein